MLKRGKVMKKLSFALLSAAISISSCSSGRMASRGDYDDVYYSKSDAAVEDYGRIANERQQQQQEPTRTEDYTSTPPSNTYQGDGDNERVSNRIILPEQVMMDQAVRTIVFAITLIVRTTGRITALPSAVIPMMARLT
jgi:hypothetical protein